MKWHYLQDNFCLTLPLSYKTSNWKGPSKDFWKPKRLLPVWMSFGNWKIYDGSGAPVPKFWYGTTSPRAFSIMAFRIWPKNCVKIERILVWERRHTVGFPHTPVIHETTDELSFSYARLEILCMSASRNGLVSRVYLGAWIIILMDRDVFTDHQ